MTGLDEECITEEEAAHEKDHPGALLKHCIDPTMCLDDVSESNHKAEHDVRDTHVDGEKDEVLEIGGYPVEGVGENNTELEVQLMVNHAL